MKTNLETVRLTAHSSRSATSRKLVTASQSIRSPTHILLFPAPHPVDSPRRASIPSFPSSKAARIAHSAFIFPLWNERQASPHMSPYCLESFHLLRVTPSISLQPVASAPLASFSYNITAATSPHWFGVREHENRLFCKGGEQLVGALGQMNQNKFPTLSVRNTVERSIFPILA